MAEHALHHSTVRLIGHQLRVTVDGIGHRVPAGCQRLLAFVALPRIRLERAYVAGTLWPSCDDVRAIGNLRTALWRLRCAGIAVIVSDKRSLGLASGTDVDVHHVAAWAGRLIAGRPERDDLEVSAGRLPDADGETALVEACALFPAWRDEWALLQHERLRQRVLHALEAVAGLLVEGGRAADAVTVAAIAVAIDPLRESAQRSLIAAHLAVGDGAAASVAYDSFADRARRELRVEPSRRLAALLPQPAGVTIRASSGDGAMPTSVPSWTR